MADLQGSSGTPGAVAIVRDDGSILLESTCGLPEIRGTIFGKLGHWAALNSEGPWLTEDERCLTFGEGDALRRHYSRKLLSLELGASRPLAIIADNGIEHALAALAASAVGVPAAIVSSSYVSPQVSPRSKLAAVLDQLDPGFILADDVDMVGAALRAIGREIQVAPLVNGEWARGLPSADDETLSAAETRVDLDTVAKLLFTSGSTGTPKAVMNTQRMMVSNMLALSRIWPFLDERPPVMVDWLPWNHTFGGNCCFNIALWFGGHLHVDKGKPTPGLIGRTVAAIRNTSPTVYFNVPLGHELLVRELENDRELAQTFFSGLEFLFNAGAAMPDALRARINRVAIDATGRPPRIVGGWGSTETAPFATVLDVPTDVAANLGWPIPGTTIKMIPLEDRFELRVKGPNVTPGYWRDEVATEAAFDEEGFYRIGDAGRFVDPRKPSQGIVFGGRLAENFKLSSGTFVNVGSLRLAVINASDLLISDAVIAGEGKDEIGLIVFANEAACRAVVQTSLCQFDETGPAMLHPLVEDRIAARLREHNARAKGSSMRVARFLIAEDQPSLVEGEITEKGYLNQKRVLERRAQLVARLYAQGREV